MLRQQIHLTVYVRHFQCRYNASQACLFPPLSDSMPRTRALKSSLHEPLCSTFEPTGVERGWALWWETSGLYQPICVPKHHSTTYHSRAPLSSCYLPDDRQIPFSILLPPPNVTGHLHLGHALTVSLQDTLIRWRRMRGHPTLYLPGLDHAGIATQAIVERRLAQQSLPQSKLSLGREAFLRQVWQVVRDHSSAIVNQMRTIGASLDWSKAYFTLDKSRSDAVSSAFIKLYTDGLIYRAPRIVHWSASLGTALSDIEVETRVIDSPTTITLPGRRRSLEVGWMYHIEFPILSVPTSVNAQRIDSVTGTAKSLVVSTTRPETMFGDQALAVHPEDERYRHLIGGIAQSPLTGMPLPIIGDSHLVDISKGSGVVKVTPAHDPFDFECAKRHHLKAVNIFTDSGTIILPMECSNNNISHFQGLDRLDSRAKVVEYLGASVTRSPHPMTLSICSRSGDLIEPLLRNQWFLNVSDMASQSLDAAIEGRINLHPSSHLTTWQQWLAEPRDWCLSRQLWWGHRIPAYRVILSSHSKANNITHNNNNNTMIKDDGPWIVAPSISSALSQAQAMFDSNVSVIQDEDVLDTWFSSGLLPLSALGWPLNPQWLSSNPSSKTSEDIIQTDNSLDSVWQLRDCVSNDKPEPLRQFYPWSLMETGSDILFFWVARMTMLSSYFMKSFDKLTDGRSIATPWQMPFNHIYLHPIVRDSEGRKMSKSLGNVVDPLDLISGVSLKKLLDNLKNDNLPSNEVQRSSTAMRQAFPNGIPACGVDALRFSLIEYSQQGRQINLDLSRPISNRQFCNKIWQAAKYVLACTGEGVGVANIPAISQWILNNQQQMSSSLLMDRWILSRFGRTVSETELALNQFDFHRAARCVHDFFWNDFCDWYLENSKFALKTENCAGTRTILHVILESWLRLAHPLLPFITEELWQRMALPAHVCYSSSDHEKFVIPPVASLVGSIMVAPYPSVVEFSDFVDDRIEEDMTILKDVIRAGRSMKQSLKMKSSSQAMQHGSLSILTTNQSAAFLFTVHNSTVCRLAGVSTTSIEVHSDLADSVSSPSSLLSSSFVVSPTLKLLMTIPDLSDDMAASVSATIHNINKLEEKLLKAASKAELISSRMFAEQYLTKVPIDIQKKDQVALQHLESIKKQLGEEINKLKKKL